MICDQAFYTRESSEGFNLHASSKADPIFKNSCSRIGSSFKTENNSSEIAEFWYYSREFGRIVGVGVNSSGFRDETKSVVHIWVPAEGSLNPSEYYLPYEFDRNYSSSVIYKSREFEPCVSEKDYGGILERFQFTSERLKELLYKLVLVIGGEEKQLQFVFPYGIDPTQKRVMARELMWLLSTLIPAADEDKGVYERTMSYSVFSRTNTRLVVFPFVDEVPENGINFKLNSSEPFSESRMIPKVFGVLAEKALGSLREYKEFIFEMLGEGWGQDRLTCEKLCAMYYLMELRKGEISDIKKAELPIKYENLVRTTAESDHYREILFRLLSLPNDLDIKDIVPAYKELEKNRRNYNAAKPDLVFLRAYEEVLEKSNREGFIGILEDGLINIQENPSFRDRVVTDIWNKTGTDSLIANDISGIADAKGFLEKTETYEVLLDDNSFKSLMKNILFDKDIYFQMDAETREKVRAIYGDEEGATEKGLPFLKRILKRLADFFITGSDRGIDFFESEIGRIDDEFVTGYFEFFVNKSKEIQQEYRTRIQDVGHEFIEQYRGWSIRDDLINDFNEMDRSWKRHDLQEDFKRASINDLAEYDFSDFERYSECDQREFIKIWCDEVFSRLKPDTAAVDCAVFEKFALREKDVERYDPDLHGKYMNMLWENCESDLSKKIACSLVFGADEYTVWEDDEPCQIDAYSRISNELKMVGRQGAGIIESTTIKNERADFNRCCYLLWKKTDQGKAVGDDDLNIYTFERAKSCGLSREWGLFLGELMESLRAADTAGNDTACSNYMYIYTNLASNKNYTPDQRGKDYATWYLQNRAFYDHLIRNPARYRSECKTYIDEMILFEELDEVTHRIEKEKSADNFYDVSQILYDSEKVFGTEFEQVKKLDQVYAEESRDLSNSISDMKKDIEKMNENNRNCQVEISRLRTELSRIQQRLFELQKEVEDNNEQIRKKNRTIEQYDRILKKAEQLRNNGTDRLANTNNEYANKRGGQSPDHQTNRQYQQNDHYQNRAQENRDNQSRKKYVVSPLPPEIEENVSNYNRSNNGNSYGDANDYI